MISVSAECRQPASHGAAWCAVFEPRIEKRNYGVLGRS
jgi:hypothetical protein